jgi:hypothetical protein
LDRLNIELLERRLQLLVVHTSALVHLLDLSSGCALSAVASLSAFRSYTPLLKYVCVGSMGYIFTEFVERLDTYPTDGVSYVRIDN